MKVRIGKRKDGAREAPVHTVNALFFDRERARDERILRLATAIDHYLTEGRIFEHVPHIGRSSFANADQTIASR